MDAMLYRPSDLLVAQLSHFRLLARCSFLRRRLLTRLRAALWARPFAIVVEAFVHGKLEILEVRCCLQTRVPRWMFLYTMLHCPNNVLVTTLAVPSCMALNCLILKLAPRGRAIAN